MYPMRDAGFLGIPILYTALAIDINWKLPQFLEKVSSEASPLEVGQGGYMPEF
jgi:hypothetical protein